MMDYTPDDVAIALASGLDEKHDVTLSGFEQTSSGTPQVTLLDAQGTEFVRWRESVDEEDWLVILIRTDGGWASVARLYTILTSAEAAAAVVASIVEMARAEV